MHETLNTQIFLIYAYVHQTWGTLIFLRKMLMILGKKVKINQLHLTQEVRKLKYPMFHV